MARLKSTTAPDPATPAPDPATPVAEALAMLHASRGDEALTDALALAADHRDRAHHLANALANRQLAGGLKTYLAEAHRNLKAAREAEDWARALAALAGRPGDGPPRPESTLAEDVHRLAVDAGGDAIVREFRVTMAQISDELRARLAAAEDRVGSLAGQVRTGSGAFGGETGPKFLTAWMAEVLPHVRARRQLAARLASLEQDTTRARAAQAAAVARAVESAGGVEAIAHGLREAGLIDGTWFLGDDQAEELATVAADLDVARSHLTVLRLDPGTDPATVPGQFGRSILARHADLSARHDLLRAAADERALGFAREEIARAVAGDEPARARLERDVAAFPDAFPSGFLAEWRAAQFERSALGALIVSIIHGE